MASLMKIIHYTIVLWVFIICLSVMRWTVLPGFTVFIPALDFGPATAAWNVFMTVGQWIVIISLVIFIMLWIIYKILMRIFPINLIIKNAPPFRELRRAGIFSLFDAIFGIIFSADSASKRVIRLGKAVGGFVTGNVGMMRETVQDMAGTNKGVPSSNKSTDVKPSSRNEEESPFSKEDIARTNEEFQQCIEEKTVVITPSMSSTDVKSANLQNSLLEIQCKVQAMQTAMNNFAYSV